jgi:YesN/AraC family two-component response regulator
MDMVDPFEQRIQRFQLILLLQSLKQVFDLDRQFCLITIAVSLQQHETADLAVAYERVLELAKKRKLADETITDKLNITGAYLSTYFKEKNGINFSDYLNAYRMNKAKDLL